MTADKARKVATRQRMAETGEPYSVARHIVQDERDASDDMANAGPAVDESYSDAELLAQQQADEARRLADRARHLAEQARERAERLEEAADQAEEAADQAEEAADEAENLVDEFTADESWSNERHHRPPRPPRPSRPPQPLRPQDRADQVMQRLEQMRDRAGRLISAAERIFGRPDPTDPS